MCHPPLINTQYGSTAGVKCAKSQKLEVYMEYTHGAWKTRAHTVLIIPFASWRPVNTTDENDTSPTLPNALQCKRKTAARMKSKKICNSQSNSLACYTSATGTHTLATSLHTKSSQFWIMFRLFCPKIIMHSEWSSFTQPAPFSSAYID